VDNKNELTNTPTTGTITYDSNGNMTSQQNSHANTYTYDDENRLVDFQDTVLGHEAVFVYDGLGRLRIRQEYQNAPSSPLAGDTLKSETHYIYDGWRVIQERNGTNNTPTVSYTRGNDLSGSLQGAGGIGGLLARSSGYSSGNWTTNNYYFADGNGNVTYMLNSSQTMVASYRYDPFGNTLSSSGTLASANVYRFSSKEIHINSGMYYYGFRFYDPNLQRWINRDPIEERGGYNLYSFVANNPLFFIDPYGLDVDDLHIECPTLELPPQPPPISLVPPPQYLPPPPNVWYPPPNPDYSPPFTWPPDKGWPSIPGPFGSTINPGISNPFNDTEPPNPYTGGHDGGAPTGNNISITVVWPLNPSQPK